MLVDLYVDHLAPRVPLAHTSQITEAYIAEPYRYQIAAKRIGLSESEYAEFRQDVEEGRITYRVLPRHVDAMSARRSNGNVYALHNVTVPAGTMGWVANLSDGATVVVPQLCGNLSLSRSHHVAIVKPRKPFRNTSYAGYFPPTQVTFAVPSAPVTPVRPEAIGVASTPAAPPATHRFSAFWLAPIAAIPALLTGGGSHTVVPPCSAGSNLFGACRP